jgi:hypothetical protein
VDADGGNVEFAARGAFVERLDVLQNMLETEAVRRNQIFRQRVKHEGVIGVGRMAERQSRLLHRQKIKRRNACCHDLNKNEKKNPAESPHTPPGLKRAGTRESHAPPARASHRTDRHRQPTSLLISHGLASGQIQRGVRVRRSGKLLVNSASSHPNQKTESRTGFPTTFSCLTISRGQIFKNLKAL